MITVEENNDIVARVQVLSPAKSLPAAGPSRPRVDDTDRHIGARLRARRIALGLTQQQLGDMVGVTYQQAYKYEMGINRIAGGRLRAIAQALSVEVSYFFADADDRPLAVESTARARQLVELTRNFAAIRDERMQEAICDFVRILANSDLSNATLVGSAAYRLLPQDPARADAAAGSPCALDAPSIGP